MGGVQCFGSVPTLVPLGVPEVGERRACDESSIGTRFSAYLQPSMRVLIPLANWCGKVKG